MGLLFWVLIMLALAWGLAESALPTPTPFIPPRKHIIHPAKPVPTPAAPTAPATAPDAANPADPVSPSNPSDAKPASDTPAAPN
ncbi:MAG: hypothetical protein JO142_04710 [Burkholderiales bacterium]|nr:hypothetical protein [Burkholderiales bacterium]